jgi:hypothetical protein
MAVRLAVDKTTGAGSAPSAARPMKTTPRAIYWLEQPDGRIKHGVTTEGVRSRRVAADLPLNRFGVKGRHFLVAAMCGEVADEQSNLAHFREYLVPGEREVFYPAEPLVGYLRWSRKQPFTHVEQDTDWVEAGTTFDLICPGPGRVAPAPDDLSPESDLFTELGRDDFWGTQILTGDDYYTPAYDIERVRDCLGEIELDPASHRIANRIVKATTFYQLSENGLILPWFGGLYMNCPFSRWDEFGPKLISSVKSGDVKTAIALMHSAKQTSVYMRPFVEAADAECIRTGRMDFWGKHVEDGNGSGAKDGQIFLYYGNDVRRFNEVFGGSYGVVRVPYKP